MIGHFIQRTGMLIVAISLTVIPVPQTAKAAIIQTDTAIEITDRQHQIDRIDSLLAQDAVQKALVSLGVDPDDASARVHALTAAELQILEQRLPELPAGSTGVVEVVGIVAIVLIILELLNVTNFFTEF